jgi:hypothetical protein
MKATKKMTKPSNPKGDAARNHASEQTNKELRASAQRKKDSEEQALMAQLAKAKGAKHTPPAQTPSSNKSTNRASARGNFGSSSSAAALDCDDDSDSSYSDDDFLGSSRKKKSGCSKKEKETSGEGPSRYRGSEKFQI